MGAKMQGADAQEVDGAGRKRGDGGGKAGQREDKVMTPTVFDTNVLVRALLSLQSPPVRLLELAVGGKNRLILSPHLLEELERVFAYPSCRGFSGKIKSNPANWLRSPPKS
jgi:hypothetical protein